MHDEHERCIMRIVRRSEARAALQRAASMPGRHVTAALYALALTDAEGGHYDDAVQHAQRALEAVEVDDASACTPGGGCMPTAPIVALLALLLSARCDVPPPPPTRTHTLTNLACIFGPQP